jgi:hypothetical protein
VLSFREGDDHWRLGAAFDSASCAQASVWLDDCLWSNPTTDKVLQADCDFIGHLDPFTVYVGSEQPVLGRLPAAARDFLVQQLERSEWPAVESQVMEMLSAAATEVGPLPDLTVALGAVENEVAGLYGGEGVILVSRLTATLLTDRNLIQRAGSRLETMLGTPVIAAAWDGEFTPGTPPDQATIVGSGALVGYRSPIEVVEAIDRQINRYGSVAERTYAIGWDCTPVKATVSLTTP